MRKLLPFLFVFQSCLGWGDSFAERKQIVGSYYLIEEESGGYSIGYKINGVYVGRSPMDTKLLAYAVRDSLLAMKVQFPMEKNISSSST